MIKFLRLMYWLGGVAYCAGRIFVDCWEPRANARRRSERQWENFERGARVRWAYAEQTERFNYLNNQGYTAGPMP